MTIFQAWQLWRLRRAVEKAEREVRRRGQQT